MTTAPLAPYAVARPWRGRALALLGGLAVSFSLVSHFWPHDTLHLTRTLWYVALAAGALALAWPVGWLTRAGRRVWAAETPGGRRQAVAACVGFGLLLNAAAVYRFGLWGDNLWLQAPPVAAALRPVLWLCDAAVLAAGLGALLTLGTPPRPPDPATARPPLLRGRVGLACVAVVTLAWVNAAVGQFVAHERTAHYWDFAGYWLTCAAYAETLARSPGDGWRQLLESFAVSDYTLLPALPPSLVMVAAGDSRLAYELAVGNLYGGAVALAAVFAVASVARGVGPAGAAWVAGLAATCPVVWDPTLRGYLDLGGVALALAALGIYLSRPAAELRWRHVLALGATLATLLLFRRWYSFWVVAFVAVALAEAALTTLRSRSFRLGDWRPVVVAGGVAGFLFASIAWPAVRRVAATDYAAIYAAYRTDAGVWPRLADLALEVGHGYGVAYAVAAVLAVAHPATRRAGLFATAMLPVTLAHFYRVQDMGFHHRMLLAPSYLLVVGLAVVPLLKAPRGVRAVGLPLGGALMLAGFALSFAPRLNATRAACEPWVTRSPAYPGVRDDIDELLALADDAEREAAARGTPFAVVASSMALNQTHVTTVRPSLGLPRLGPPRQVALPEVDKAFGFPNAFFDCAVVVATDPPQTHLRAGEQVAIETLARQVWAGDGLGAAFDRLPRVYALNGGGVRAQVFVRRRPFTQREVDDFSGVLRAAHPDKPFVYEPRPGLLETGR